MSDETRTALSRQVNGAIEDLQRARQHMEDDSCDQTRAVTSGHRGQYQTFDAYASLTDALRDDVNAQMGWTEVDQDNYLDNRDGMGDWLDQPGRDPEEESWLSDAIEAATGWRWEDGELVESSPESCDICCGGSGTPSERANEWMSERPLEIVREVGTPLTVLLTCGGPHVELVHDLRDGGPRIVGYWGGEKVIAHDKVITWAMQYYFPEDY